MAQRFIMPLETAFGSDGLFSAGAKLNFYATGSSSRLDTYSDNALTTANANPVVANSAGRFGPIFLKAEEYKVVLTDANDVEIWNADPVSGGTGTAGVTLSEQASAPATAAGEGAIYTKDTGGQPELFYREESNGDEVQITKGGGLNASDLADDWSDLASATSTDLGSVDSAFVNVTGTTTITGLGTPSADRPLKWVKFAGALTLTHNATSLILPTGSDISVLAGDVAAFKYEGSDNWRCVQAPQRWFANLPAAVTASGTTVDFTVPAGCTRARLVLRSLSTNGTSQINVQLGDSGGVETTGYSGGTTTNGTFGNANVGFPLSNGNNAAAYAWSGLIELQARSRGGSEWVVNGGVSVPSNVGSVMSGSKDLNSRLETVRITAANGTDTFDLGEVSAWFYFD